MERTPTKDAIHLIVFGPQQEGAGFQQVIRALGYHVEVTPGRDWLSAACVDSRQCPQLLFFGEQPYPKEPLLTALRERRVSFGVFHRIPWDEDIVNLCTEASNWPCDQGEFAFRLQRFLCHARSVLPVAADPDPLYEFARFNMIGRSPAFINALELTRKIARCGAPVLIEGETGTGKELIARAVHYLGTRRDFPFIPVNCGAIPENLIENELFGHERGAFTDAKDAQPGLITQAHRGTLFLDEMEALPYRGQVALLRFLQDRQYRPLGAKHAVSADVRIISASNADLEHMVETKRFREDLLFRLNIMSIRLPSLRERAGDAVLLAEYFIERFSNQYGLPVKSLHPDTLAWLHQHEWPGNVRELENLIHRQYLLTNGPVICIEDCGGADKQPADCSIGFNEAKNRVIADFEKAFLTSVLADAKGNVTLAAKRAGKERRAFGKLLKKHAINREQFQGTELSD